MNEKQEEDETEELQRWRREQLELKSKVVQSDTERWQQEPGLAGLERVAGADISFSKKNEGQACVSLVVLEFPTLQVSLVSKMLDVIFVDGNGVLHPRGFGLACHLGVLVDLPCIGVAKDLLCVDGLEKDDHHRAKVKMLKTAGDSFPLVGISGKTLGTALLGCSGCSNPVYISVGHRISLDTATRLALACFRYRVPEPIRQADIRSREFLRLRKQGGVSVDQRSKLGANNSTADQPHGKD
uniref:endonuclease V isoform X2 n=1 Tax=Myxine glutinosa TaxID=7769 RepID=UPI00358FCD19